MNRHLYCFPRRYYYHCHYHYRSLSHFLNHYHFHFHFPGSMVSLSMPASGLSESLGF